MSNAQSAGAGSADSVGGAVHNSDDAAQPTGQNTLDEPVLTQNNASTQEKLDGIAAQTRVDLGEESHDRYIEVLKQRLSDSAIELTDDDVTSLARRSHPSGGGV